jgi:hypothetical protein
MGFFGAFGNPSAKINLNGIEFSQEVGLILISGLTLFISLYIKYGLTWQVFSILPIFFVSAYKVECMQVGSCYAFAQYISLLTFIISITIIINIYKNRNK